MENSVFGAGAETGLHPRVFVEHKQAELRRLLPVVSMYLGLLNDELVHETDTAKRQQIALNGIQELDSQWPFMNHHFLVNGWLAGPEPTVHEQGIDFNYELRRETMTNAVSKGYDVQLHAVDEPPQIGFLFQLGSQVVKASGLRVTLTSYAVAKVEDVSLTYLAPPRASSEQFLPYSTVTVQTYNALLHDAYHDAKDEFYRMSSAEQRLYLVMLIDSVTEKICAAEYPAYAIAEVPFVYIRQPGAESKFFRRKAVPGGRVAGWIQAASVLELQKLDESSLASKRDLIDPDAGVCLVCRLPSNADIAAYGATDIFIPTARSRSLAFPKMELVEKS